MLDLADIGTVGCPYTLDAISTLTGAVGAGTAATCVLDFESTRREP